MIILNKNYLSQVQKDFAKHMGIPMADDGYAVKFVESEQLSVLVKDNNVTIEYSVLSELYRGLALLKDDCLRENEKITQRRDFNSLAAFLDCSRNAVLKVDAVKKIIMDIAALGYNQLYLYTEDTYEIPEYPYFGHLRGRYSASEIKEMDQYAKLYGIELIPAIQTLAHLDTIFRWDCFSEVGAKGSLYCGEEKTYELIDRMFASLRNMYTTDKINIGMDEAHNLDAAAMERFLKHVQRVTQLAFKHGFKPMMWSDMFFKIANKQINYNQIQATNFADEVLDSIPDEIGLVYWNYSECTPEFYDDVIKSHVAMNKRILFAGGARKWIGFCPHIDGSLNAGRNALPVCKKYNIKDVIVTGWGDCGGEAPAYMMLPGLISYSEACYVDDMSDEVIDKKLQNLFGYKLDDFRTLEKLNFLPNNPSNCANTTKLALFNDPILGLYDKHIPENVRGFFQEITKELEPLKEKDNKIAYIFESIYYLSRVLEVKADIGHKLRPAYKNGDKTVLKAVCDELPIMIERLDEFHKIYRKNWLKENKIFGFEVQDIRIGTLRARLCYTKDVLEDYLSGNISEIPELKEECLYIDCREENSTAPLNTTLPFWSTIATTNVI